MRELLIAVPSRRPANVARLQSAMRATCTAGTTLLAGLDADDPALGEYPAGPEYVIRDGLSFVTDWMNELAVPRAGQYAAIGCLGDDNVPVTEGWDAAILAALEDHPFAFGNDRYPGREPGTLCCHIFARAGVVRALGYLGPPLIRHMYVDVAWMAWGTACGIAYLDDVVIEHRHYTSGAAYDETYARSRATAVPGLAAWHAYSRERLNEDIGKLGGVPFTPAALAEFNEKLGIPGSMP